MYHSCSVYIYLAYPFVLKPCTYLCSFALCSPLLLLYIYFSFCQELFFGGLSLPIFILYHILEICQLLFYCLSDSKKKGGYLNSPGNFDMKFTYSFLILILFMEVNFSISINSSTSNGASSSFSKLKFSFSVPASSI